MSIHGKMTPPLIFCHIEFGYENVLNQSSQSIPCLLLSDDPDTILLYCADMVVVGAAADIPVDGLIKMSVATWPRTSLGTIGLPVVKETFPTMSRSSYMIKFVVPLVRNDAQNDSPRTGYIKSVTQIPTYCLHVRVSEAEAILD
jgi:hypothetical protein